MKIRITEMIKVGLMTVLLGLCLTTTVSAGIPGNTHAFGKTQAAWNEIYWRWYLGELKFPPDNNNNSVVAPHVVLMPLPNAPGDGTPGSINVTLNSGQAFVLPLWSLLGTDYTDSTPADPLAPLSIFQTLNISFKIDGKTVIDQTNVMKFFSMFYFTPPVILNSPPTKSVIWFEGIGVVHQPLSVGTHTFTLDAKNTESLPSSFCPPPPSPCVIEYHNEWTVTVQPSHDH